jgi:RimJ/RimL family protein N-acetyltransferase
MPRAIAPREWLNAKTCRLRLVELTDCTERYVDWLRDPDVNKYLETRWTEQSLASVESFVRSVIGSDHSYLFAICEHGTDRHVGNIKIGPIETRHLYADVSYFIGDRAAWGRGMATDAVRTVTAFGFERLGLHRVQAGFYDTNVGSQRVLEKAGFTYEGRLVKKLRQRADTAWEDHLWYYALAGEWPAAQP